MGAVSHRWLFLGAAVAAALCVAPTSSAREGVAVTRHNLSVSGPGEVRAASETEICIFCHAGHVEAQTGPLWNRRSSGQPTYRPYESASLASRPGQPTGVSLMCLSCHDGTVAVGVVANRDARIDILGMRSDRLEPGSGGLGTDLSGTHPVSVEYRSAAGRAALDSTKTSLRLDPEPLGTRPLVDRTGQVQCTACHDPHEDPAASGLSVPPFWRGSSFDEVCTSCHEAPVVDGGHQDPGLMPAGCGSCHVGHGVTQQPLLPAAEEDSCLSCHGSRVDLEDARREGRVVRLASPTSILAELDKPYSHPVRESRGLHDPDEDLREGVRARRHVECADCHPVHGVESFDVASTLRQRGASRDDLVGGRVEHDLCYDCHGSSGDLPYGQTDKSAEFAPSNESYHPVEASLDKRDVPSLLSPWLQGDVMSCGDCHGSENPDSPDGPHGSRNQWLLKGRYEAVDDKPESPTTYEACYSCHSRSSILSNDSFEGHFDHIVVGGSSCYACHDSHGSPDYPGLIRFGKDFRYSRVLPSSSGRLEYDESGGGSCYLSCHDVDHDPLGYP